MDGSTRNLTRAIASGDPEAFARFYRDRFDEMYREARRVTGRDESFCLDVVQDSMLRVIRSLRPMEHETEITRWLRVVVRTCAYDHVRRESRQRRHEEAAARDVSAEPARDAREHERELAWLHDQIASAEEPAARLLVMRHRFGWTLQRIGRAAGLKPGAVDGQLRRFAARLRLRASEELHDE